MSGKFFENADGSWSWQRIALAVGAVRSALRFDPERCPRGYGIRFQRYSYVM